MDFFNPILPKDDSFCNSLIWTRVILAQYSAAGDQSPHPICEKQAQTRMWELAGLTERQVIANRICDAVTDTLNIVNGTASENACLRHRVAHLDLPLAPITQQQADEASSEAEAWRARYEDERKKLDRDPELQNQPRWYVMITQAYRKSAWYSAVVNRFHQ